MYLHKEGKGRFEKKTLKMTFNIDLVVCQACRLIGLEVKFIT